MTLHDAITFVRAAQAAGEIVDYWTRRGADGSLSLYVRLECGVDPDPWWTDQDEPASDPYCSARGGF
jgi:hypothetical protein